MERRVYELASILGVTNEQMIEILWDNNINAKDHMSIINGEDFNRMLIIQNSFNNYKTTLNTNRSSLKSIKINGLFYKKGYNYYFNFKDDINILIAENGSGKTTILNIIISILKGEVEKLKALPFESVDIDIKGKKYTINKNNLIDNNIDKEELMFMLRRLRGALPTEIYLNLRDSIEHNQTIDIYQIKYLIDRYSLNRSYQLDDISYRAIRELEYLSRKNGYNHETIKLFEEISKAIDDEILAFPTYRRIEEELDRVIELSEQQKNDLRYKLNNSTLNFGISDIKNTIEQLTEKLRQDANDYYTKMNAEILNDLLSNEVKLNKAQKNKIDKDKINIVIGRIGENKIKKLDKLRNFIDNTSNVQNGEFLQYYIFKLINIYEAQKPLDDKIKKYKEICNKYLVNKQMVYDEVKVKVMIVDNETKQEILLEHLSSGEKQILSLFARLYLSTTKPCIFIIDEPELSLSIIWQKNLLEDIYDSNKINLLIVTTHSPFIFKNRFRTFAKELDSLKELEK
jgi:predicted ATPase